MCVSYYARQIVCVCVCVCVLVLECYSGSRTMKVMVVLLTGPSNEVLMAETASL